MIPEPQLTVTSALTRKVHNCIDLSDQERRALAHEFRAVREFNAHVELPSTTDSERGTLVILKGFACRYRVLFNGHREIVGLLLPGDLSEPCAYAQTRHPYSIASLSAVRAAWIGRLALAQLLERMPGLNRLLWQLAALEQSIAREWIQNVGRRTARERLAHLLCEIFERQRRVGLVSQGQCDLPMTQVELGDALALSAVHRTREIPAAQLGKRLSRRLRWAKMLIESTRALACGGRRICWSSWERIRIIPNRMIAIPPHGPNCCRVLECG